jgi:hypothetical protein
MDGKPLTMAQAWRAHDRLFEDERVGVVAEPAEVETRFRKCTAVRKVSTKRWADTWLFGRRARGSRNADHLRPGAGRARRPSLAARAGDLMNETPGTLTKGMGAQGSATRAAGQGSNPDLVAVVACRAFCAAVRSVVRCVPAAAACGLRARGQGTPQIVFQRAWFRKADHE